MSIRVYYNGAWVTLAHVQTGDIRKESLDGSLFTQTLSFDCLSKPNYPPHSLVDIDGRKWVIGDVEQTRSAKPAAFPIYNVSLTLVELTKLLEQYILAPCAFSNPSDTLYAQVVKALNHAEVLRYGETNRFVISAELTALLTAKAGEEFRYEAEAPLREVLDDMFGTLNFRVVVSDVAEDLSTFYLSYLDEARHSADIVATPKCFSDSDDQNSEYLAAEYETNLANALTAGRRTVTEEWSTLKPVEGTLADTNSVRLVTNIPIEQLTSVLVRMEVLIGHHDLQGNNYAEETVPLTAEAIGLFVEQELYDAMDLTDQYKYIPYARGSRDIGVLATYKKLFITRAKLIEHLLVLFHEAGIVWCTENDYLHNGSIVYEGQLWEEVLFQVSYVPYLDLHARVGKLSETLPFHGTILSNQTDRTIDVDRYSKHLQALANRSGNKKLVLGCERQTEADLLQLGDRIAGGFTLVSRELQTDRAAITACYTFFQHYDTVLNTRISRERRLFAVPVSGYLKRDVLIKERLLASTAKAPANTGLLSDQIATKYFLKTFNSTGDPDTPMDRIMFSTSDGVNSYGLFGLPLLGTAVGRSMHWQFKPFDNYSVGFSANVQVIGGKSVHQNPYVNSVGEFKNLTFKLINSSIEDAAFASQLIIGKAMPLIPFQMQEVYVEADFTNGFKTIILEKDRFEAISGSFQLEVTPTDPDEVVIGDYLAKYSSLLYGKNNTPLILWISGSEKYEHYETAKCKGDPTTFAPLIDETNLCVLASGPTFRGLKSWAIGDAAGNLVLGVNNDFEDLDRVYFTVSR